MAENVGYQSAGRSIQHSRRLRTLIGILLPLLIIALGWRAYRHVVPAGTDFYPTGGWLEAVAAGPELTSPDGSTVIHVLFNDAGRAHRGFHWTWLVADEWLTGKRVLAEGYSDTSVRQGAKPFPSRWLDAKTMSAVFVRGQFDDAPSEEVVISL